MKGHEYHEEIPLSAEQKTIVDCQCEAAFKVFKAINDNNLEANIFFSPLSFTFDLSMIANGATGETLNQIKELLGVSNLSIADINKLNRLLLEELPIADQKTSLSLANSIWINKNIELEKEFKTTVEDYYDATIKTEDLATDKARQSINKWASNATNKLISEFLESNLDPSTVSVILNALYFKGRWQEIFDIDATKNGKFKTSNGSAVNVPMMKNYYLEATYYDDGGTMVGMPIPYGNGSYTMTVIKPYNGISVDELIAKLSSESYNNLKKNSQLSQITLTMPRFKIDSDISFKAVLNQMEFGNILSSNYPLIHPSSNSFISDIQQKTKIIVDEEGSEAAAVTDVLMCGSLPQEFELPKVTLKLNSPFIFLIEEVSTNSILFIGKVSNP